MRTRFNTRLFVAWLILVGITIAYLWMDHAASHEGIPSASTTVTIAAICIALIKVRIIMREFMEVRGAPALLSRLTDAWVLLIGVALLAVYGVGKAVA